MKQSIENKWKYTVYVLNIEGIKYLDQMFQVSDVDVS